MPARGLTIAGAGMAGLCAAARARELGLEPVVLEKGGRAGGSMLISSGVVWRHRRLEDFLTECPGGDRELQRLVWERLDEGLAWLERSGAAVVARDTGNPLTTGIRFEPRRLTEALLRRMGPVRVGNRLEPGVDGPVLLATGGFGAELARRSGLARRGNAWSEGDGLRFARARGAATAGDLDEFYGRNLPAPPARVPEAEYVELAQLYGRHALVVDERGRTFAPDPPSWSEADLVQATARLPGRRAWYVVDGRALRERVRGRSVASMVDAAEAAGGRVLRASAPEGLGIALPPTKKLREPPFAAVLVTPGVTHTLGGLRVDAGARVLDEGGAPIAGLYAAGADVGAIASGGYASGLAAALVLGLTAAESAARDAGA